MNFLLGTKTIVKCSFSLGVMSILNMPTNRVFVGADIAFNIMDNKPALNIPPLVMCTSVANPSVIAATAAAMGVLTPMPCVPNVVAPWIPLKPTVMIGSFPAVNTNCMVMCMWGGVIKPLAPSQVQALL